MIKKVMAVNIAVFFSSIGKGWRGGGHGVEKVRMKKVDIIVGLLLSMTNVYTQF